MIRGAIPHAPSTAVMSVSNLSSSLESLFPGFRWHMAEGSMAHLEGGEGMQPPAGCPQSYTFRVVQPGREASWENTFGAHLRPPGLLLPVGSRQQLLAGTWELHAAARCTSFLRGVMWLQMNSDQLAGELVVLYPATCACWNMQSHMF